MIKLSMTVASACLLLAACSPVQVTDGTKPTTQRGAFFTTADDIKIEGQEGFAAVKKVVVPVFRVAFAGEAGAKSTAGGGFSHNSATVRANTKLIGADDANLQKITDQAYADFIATLKAKGYEVVDASSVTASQAYKEMPTQPNGSVIETSAYGHLRYFAPTGQALVIMPGDEGGFSGFAALSANAPAKKLAELTKTQDADILVVTYYVDYLNQNTSGGFFATTAGVEIGAGISARPGSGIQLYSAKSLECVGYCPNTVPTAKLGQAVYSTEKFGELKDTTTDAEIGGQYALAALTTLAGVSKSTYRNFELTVEPGKFESVAKTVLKDASTKLVDGMKGTPAK